MAKTNRPNGVMHDTAGDTTTGTLLIRQLVWTGAAAAADDLVIKNAAGTILKAYKAGADLGIVIDWPFGKRPVHGLETDVIDAGTVEYVYA